MGFQSVGSARAVALAVLVLVCGCRSPSGSSDGSGGTANDASIGGTSAGGSGGAAGNDAHGSTTAGDAGAAGAGGSSGGHGNPGAFVSVWEVAEDDPLELPLVETGDYAFDVVWGDGSEDRITAFDDPDATHRYARAGEYQVTIEGRIRGWDFGPVIEDCACDEEDENGDCVSEQCFFHREGIGQLREILRWGELEFGETTGHFSHCAGLVIDAPDTPRLSGSLERFFASCEVSVRGAGFSAWDTSSVTNMSLMFWSSSFDGDISGWDTSNVTSMSDMFVGSAFDGDISGWDTSSVTDMSGMFSQSAFDGDIADWNVSRVTSMHGMFYESDFAGDLSRWDVSGVNDMSLMFGNALFDGDISDWDVSQVTDMAGLFSASRFSGDLAAWNTSNVRDMSFMFYRSTFDGEISGWDVSGVRDMSSMFSQSAFDGDISSWPIESVSTMDQMFLDGALSTENYDKLLVSWSQLDLVDIVFHAGSTPYSAGAPADARELLVAKGWQISDGGLAE